MDATQFPQLSQLITDNQCEITDLWVSFTVSPATSRQKLTDVTLHPGRADEMAREFFGYGGCCLLAAALHECSGWPLLTYKRIIAGRTLHHVHMGVRTPGGMFLDITGARTDESVTEDYGPGWTQEVTLDEAVEFGAILTPWDSGFETPVIPEVIRFFAYNLITASLATTPMEGQS